MSTEINYVQTRMCPATDGTWVCCLIDHPEDPENHYYIHETGDAA